MSGRDDEPKSAPDDELDLAQHISFRDYPSTGVVVFAALVSGLGWLAYRWSRGKRPAPPEAPKGPHDGKAVPETPSAQGEGSPVRTG